MQFKDRPSEPIGTRQKRWLDYLWEHNNDIAPKTCYEYEKGRYSKWEDAQWAVCPIDHRGIITREQVIEFDIDNRTLTLEITKFLDQYLTDQKINHYLQDHNGRSPHIHIFNAPKLMNLSNSPLLRKFKLDRMKYNASGLCREIGGRYLKKEGTTFYASFFENVDEIKPIINTKEIRFPCLTLN